MMPCRTMTTHPMNGRRHEPERPNRRHFRGLARFLLMTLGLTVAATALVTTTARAAPYVPRDDARILERLPTSADAVKRTLPVAAGGTRPQSPNNLELAVRLARQYLALSRAESDPRYNGYAQAALAPWWQLTDAPVDVLVLRAMLRQNRHQFDAALSDLSRAVAADPRNAQAWFTAAMVLRVSGRLDEASRHCWRLKPLVKALATVGCVSRHQGPERTCPGQLHLAFQDAGAGHLRRSWPAPMGAHGVGANGRESRRERNGRATFRTSACIGSA